MRYGVHILYKRIFSAMQGFEITLRKYNSLILTVIKKGLDNKINGRIVVIG